MKLSIHFPAAAEPDGRRKILNVRYPEANDDVASALGSMSGLAIREALRVRNYADLASEARANRRSINAHVLALLETTIEQYSSNLELFAPVSSVLGTYRGGKGDFFHDLFPYLEAFSPDFVRRIWQKYAPEARTFLDPFAGLGTGPLTFLRHEQNAQAFFCEVNPLLQRIVALKTELLGSLIGERQKAQLQLRALLRDLPDRIRRVPPDVSLLRTYDVVFDGSEMFDASTLDQVVRARTLCSHVAVENRLVGSCFEIACLTSLVPASNMQRAGDLRRKTPRERSRISRDFLHHLAQVLSRIEAGITGFEHTPTQPILLLGDTRRLSSLEPLNVDLIVTSPPYLNGTNYFRNTKIELWFLKALNNQSDLGAYRDSSIAAGINDVRGMRAHSDPSDGIPAAFRTCVERLEASAYDTRIPQMVKWYGSEIRASITGAVAHLRRGGTIAVDIGDSIYSGVRVPTHDLIGDTLRELECNIVDSFVIRERLSRGGARAHQMCYVACKAAKTVQPKRARRALPPAWDEFKRTLPHQQYPYAKRNWGHAYHSICSFQGKLKPAIAKFLLDTFVPMHGRVLDPFCGVGTIPFEAALSGKKAYAIDLSPAAISITVAKVSRLNFTQLDRALSQLERHIAKADAKKMERWLPSFNKPLADYYHPKTLQEIVAARDWFVAREPLTTEDHALRACTMHLLHGNRPYALSRRSHPVTPFAPTGPATYKNVAMHLREKLARLMKVEVPEQFLEGDVFQDDATGIWPASISQLDAVITSPPFFDSTRFFLANWIRLWFAGWEKFDFELGQKRFLEEQQKRSFVPYDAIFRQAKERLRSGGVVVLHLGRSKKCDMAAELRTRARYWFSNADLFEESVEHCESHGIRDKGTVTQHQYLVLG